jgi:opacity protein-like surface antigen
MNQIAWKLILCTALTTMCAASQLAHAKGGDAGAGAAHAVAAQNVGADKAAEEAGPNPEGTPDLQVNSRSKTKVHATLTSTCPPPPTLMHGAYIGAQIGYGTYRVRNNIFSPAGTTLGSNLVAADTGWAGGVLMGYGAMMNRWFYMGAEIFIDANNFDQSFIFENPESGVNYTIKTGSGPTYGIALLPGIRLTESTLTFVRLGWNRLVIHTHEQFTGAPLNTTSKIVSGFAFGVGLETLITTNYSLRGEFDHMYFSSYNTTSFYNTGVSPAANQYMLSVIYHFG